MYVFRVYEEADANVALKPHLETENTSAPVVWIFDFD